jgi:hypothetical protein
MRTDGAEIRGMAAFDDRGVACALRYRVVCDKAWHTTEAVVDGWRDGQAVDLHIARAPDGAWTVNGRPSPEVAGCIDLDLSFTPATNLLPLRRLNLAVGASAEVRSAWLNWRTHALCLLPQRYARRTADLYAYEADIPGGEPFAASLRVDPVGWVVDYGGLWRTEVPGNAGGR